jgi:hypothetical protein
LHCRGDKYERVRIALTEIAPTIVNGGITSWIGVLFFLGGGAKSITMFGIMASGVIFFGLFQGLVALPALLLVVGDLITQKTYMMAISSVAFLIPAVLMCQCAWCFDSGAEDPVW